MAAHLKPAALRQRRNKVTTAAYLRSAADAARNAVPKLPPKSGRWHPQVVEWWRAVWRSPMPSEYLDSDLRGGLFTLAHLYQARWTERDTAVLVKLSAEIRLQEQRYGLSPVDRSRLRWTIQAGDAAADRTDARRARKTPKRQKDPRAVLKMLP